MTGAVVVYPPLFHVSAQERTGAPFEEVVPVSVFTNAAHDGHEQVVFCRDEASGLRAIIAIHSTALGPALGGCRMWPYASEEEALFDVLRLSRGMTYKNAAMGLNFGGGKSVIIADPRKDKTEALFRAFGRFVQSLGGRYYTAEDVGINSDDLIYVRQETDYVLGLPEASGDPSPATAFGVFCGIRACLEEAYGSDDPAGRTVAIQGAGHVGYHLAKLLVEAGARVVIADIFEDKVRRAVEDLGVETVPADAIYDVECDVFAPCALGAVINDETIPRLKCRIVAGSANNQLAEPRHGDRLQELGILYAPDYVINGGGVINVASEFNPGGYNRDHSYRKIAGIGDKLREIFAIARREGIPTYRAADVLAEERIRQIRALDRIFVPAASGSARG
ncbi:MAG: Glu/Leu/Phe/Val dehydrogenase [Clostridia bacterium]|nr:Glu/Leu/Phe/Val dehydrogenase [Clostridia bacterium]